jgi:hypothetical protein
MSDSQTVQFPPVAQERMTALRVQIASLEAQLQQFADGVMIGMGIDVLANDIAVDLSTFTATITPKREDN